MEKMHGFIRIPTDCSFDRHFTWICLARYWVSQIFPGCRGACRGAGQVKWVSKEVKSLRGYMTGVIGGNRLPVSSGYFANVRAPLLKMEAAIRERSIVVFDPGAVQISGLVHGQGSLDE